MKHLGLNGGWRALAQACFQNAIKQGDVAFMYNRKLFSVICGLARLDEIEAMVALRYAQSMKEKHGEKWYKGILNEVLKGVEK
jgi:hypothetical protein